MAPMRSKVVAENLIRRATCLTEAVLLFDAAAAVDGSSHGTGAHPHWTCASRNDHNDATSPMEGSRNVGSIQIQSSTYRGPFGAFYTGVTGRLPYIICIGGLP